MLISFIEVFNLLGAYQTDIMLWVNQMVIFLI